MRKNKMMRLASGLLVAVLLTTSMISGTFAKYVTTLSAQDEARVAKFAVSFKDNAAEVDIFTQSKVYDEDDIVDEDYTTKEAEEDVANVLGDGAVVIAPGSWGEFSFDVVNDSEVTVQYSVAYTVDEKDVPLEWSVDGGETWTQDLAAVTASADTTLAISNAGNTDQETITVYWRWVFGDSANNESDTDLGTAVTLAKPSVKIDVTFEQVD